MRAGLVMQYPFATRALRLQTPHVNWRFSIVAALFAIGFNTDYLVICVKRLPVLMASSVMYDKMPLQEESGN